MFWLTLKGLLCPMQSKTRKHTIQAIFSFLLILGWQVAYTQLIYFNSGLNIYSFDQANCVSSFVIKAQRGFTDIAFDRNGNFYGCNADLNRVYLSTGSVSKIADIGRTLNGMTISNEDIVYMGDPGGELISYDLNTEILTYHGNMGFGCAGDFTFYKGELYMAAFDNKIIKVNIEQPELSAVVLTYAASSEILGIVSDYRGCGDTKVYGLTGDTSEVLAIDFENLTVDFVCQLSIDVLGGASTTEFLASIPVTLGQPDVIQPDCKSLTGSISFPNASGMGELAFRLGNNEWQPQSSFEDLSAGVYSFQLLDEAGCTDTLLVELEAYPLLVIEELQTTPASCNQADGQIVVKASGGTGVLTYSLNGSWFLLPSHFTGLSAGMYTVYIKDNSGCIISQTVEVGNGNFNFNNYDVLPASCLQNNGAIFLYPDQMDSTKYMYAINGNAFQEESIFNDLSAGIYSIIVKHQDGCFDTLDILVGSSDVPELTLTSFSPEACNLRNGILEVYAWSGSPPFQFRLNNEIWQTNPVFTHLQSGSYTVFVRDGLGCLDSLDAFIESMDGPVILAVSTQAASCNTSNGRLDIVWDSPGGPSTMVILDGKMEPVYDLDQLNPGDYSVVLIDSLGCSLDTIVTIDATGCELTIPNIFSPNDDGVNDMFNVEVQPNTHMGINSMRIYDRWGSQVYDSFSHLIDTSPVISWDGSFRGKKCPPGVYTYIILIRDSENNVDFVFGDLTLIR